jgi:polyhydroxyalkanoate synthesis repressor PhaR
MATTRRASVAKESKATTPKASSRAASKATIEVASVGQPRVLKKYPNRRLYDTETSSYITLADVKKMVMSGQAFVVRDAKTADDLTRSILLQIILEEETGGVPMFSSQSLAQIIRFYGQAMQGMMGSYLEHNLQAFTEIQARVSEQSKGLYDPQAMSPELWTQFLAGQAPAMQGLMGNYLEQSKNMFTRGRFFRRSYRPSVETSWAPWTSAKIRR